MAALAVLPPFFKLLFSFKSLLTLSSISSAGAFNSFWSWIVWFLRFDKYSWALGPDNASILLIPEATLLWLVIIKIPRSPVLEICVPPQSSREKSSSPIDNTLTWSSYFSPNKDSAPEFLASSKSIILVLTAEFLSISSFTKSSILDISSSDKDSSCEKSNLSLCSSTSEPFCLTWSPSTLFSAAWTKWVAEWWASVFSLFSLFTLTSILSSIFKLPLSNFIRCIKTFPDFLQSKMLPSAFLDLNQPLSPTCPPDSA